jgi:hypothetical protein
VHHDEEGPKPRALLLGGGTALGAVQLYCMKKLVETHGLDAYTHVAGVSVGAANGIMFAQDRLDALDALWRTVKGKGWFLGPTCRVNHGLTSLRPLRRRLNDVVSLSQIKPHMTFWCGVNDFESDKYRSLSHKAYTDDDELRDAIAASCAQPLIMEGYRVRVAPGDVFHLCFDGGVRHVAPLLPTISEVEAVDVVLCEPHDRINELDPAKLRGLFRLAGRALATYHDNVVTGDIRRLQGWADAGLEVDVYAPEAWDDEWNASAAVIEHRLDVVGKEMWDAGPKTPQEVLDSFPDNDADDPFV